MSRVRKRRTHNNTRPDLQILALNERVLTSFLNKNEFETIRTSDSGIFFGDSIEKKEKKNKIPSVVESTFERLTSTLCFSEANQKPVISER